MSDTVLVALITLATSAVTQIIINHDRRRAERHALAAEQSKSFEEAHLAVLSEYAGTLAALLKYELQDGHLENNNALNFELHRAYQIAMMKAAVFVSEDTFQAMQAIPNPLAFDPSSKEVQHLITCLRRDYIDKRARLDSVLTASAKTRLQRTLEILSEISTASPENH